MSVNSSLIHSSVSKEDIRYYIQDFDNDTFLETRFKWLDKWMLYLPLYVPITPSKIPRRKACNILIILFLIITIICIAFQSIDRFLYTTFSHNFLLLIGTICQVSVSVSSRLLSLIYYYFYFNYPWHSKLTSFSNNMDDPCLNNNKNCIRIVKNYRTIMKLYVFIYFVAWISIYVGSVLFYHDKYDEVGEWFSGILVTLFMMIFTEIPNCVAILVQATICFKHYWLLSQIMNNMKTNMSIQELNYLFTQYKLIYKAFKKDYSFYLKWSVRLYICNWLLEMLVGSQNPMYSRATATTWTKAIGLLVMGLGSWTNTLIQILLYIVTSAVLSETFQSLQELLWNKLNGFISDCEEGTLKCQYMLTSFIVYTTKYQINISFAGLVVTRRNIVCFIIGFAAAKIGAEIFRVMY